jgi:hypothetical protein
MVSQYGHSILIISLKCLSITSILFSVSSFLLLSFAAENANHNAAIVMAMNIAEKIRTICHADVAAISLTHTTKLIFSSNYALDTFPIIFHPPWDLAFMNQKSRSLSDINLARTPCIHAPAKNCWNSRISSNDSCVRGLGRVRSTVS